MPTLAENLTVEQGSDYRHAFPVTTGQGVARNLTGWTATGVVRHHARGDVLYDLPLTLSAGRILLAIPAAVSAGWTWRRARYEIKLTGPQRQTERHAAGEIVVDPQLVR